MQSLQFSYFGVFGKSTVEGLLTIKSSVIREGLRKNYVFH